MRKSVLSVIFFFVLLPSLHSQSRWIDLRSLLVIGVQDRYEGIYFLNGSTGWVIHGLGKLYKTTDGGRTFPLKYSSPNFNFFRSIGFFDESTGIIGTLTSPNTLLRTTNGGLNWNSVTSSISGTIPLGVCGISIVNQQTAMAVGEYSCPPYFLRTTDAGANWVSRPLDTSLVRSLVACHFSTADSGIVVGGYSRNSNFQLSNSVVLFTSNGGQSFTQVFKSTRTGEWGWKISFINSNTGFVSVEANSRAVVLKTTNKGLNWTERVFTDTDDLEGIGFINENTGWVGKHGATFGTTNGGANWAQVQWGFQINQFTFITDTLGYSVGNSIYKFTQESVGVRTISEEIPFRMYLHQNYPNPFNPVTRIHYELRTSGLITLKVYDAKGKEIQTLVNENQSSGIYSAEFDGSFLPSGIYFYKLEAGSFSETKKMILVK